MGERYLRVLVAIEYSRKFSEQNKNTKLVHKFNFNATRNWYMFIFLITILFFPFNLPNFFWDLINIYKYLAEKCRADNARLFSVVPCDTTKNTHRGRALLSGYIFNSEDGWGCSRKLPPQRYSKAMGMLSWAASSRWPCLSCLDDLQWSSQPTAFWDSIKAINSNWFVLNCSFLSQSHIIFIQILCLINFYE